MKRRTESVNMQPAEGLEKYHDFSKPEVLAEYRAILAANNLVDGELPGDIHVEWISLNGVRAAKIILDGAREDKLLLHIHGGAWNGGVPCVGQRAMIEIEQLSKVNIISLDYSLAPEHPFPQGFNDCIKAYLALLDSGYKAENIVTIGESAGGNLVLALSLYLKDNDLPLPGGMVLISPSGKIPSLDVMNSLVEANPEDLKLEESRTTYEMYIKDQDVTNPYISPLYGDFTGLPPTLVQFGSDDFLAQDCIEITSKLMGARVDVCSHQWEFMGHVHLFLIGVLPEAEMAEKEIADFVSSVLSD